MGIRVDADANAKNSLLLESGSCPAYMKFVCISCSQGGLQRALAFLTVAGGLSEGEYWRPRFGSPVDA